MCSLNRSEMSAKVYLNNTQYPTVIHLINSQNLRLKSMWTEAVDVQFVLCVSSDGREPANTSRPELLQLMAGLFMCQKTYWARDGEIQTKYSKNKRQCQAKVKSLKRMNSASSLKKQKIYYTILTTTMLF